jgi:hypothetical protein
MTLMGFELEIYSKGLRIGDRVLMTRAGRQACGDGPSNPRGVLGTVVAAPQRMSAWAWIRWDNGEEGSYHKAEYLEVAARPA